MSKKAKFKELVESVDDNPWSYGYRIVMKKLKGPNVPRESSFRSQKCQRCCRRCCRGSCSWRSRPPCPKSFGLRTKSCKNSETSNKRDETSVRAGQDELQLVRQEAIERAARAEEALRAMRSRRTFEHAAAAGRNHRPQHLENHPLRHSHAY